MALARHQTVWIVCCWLSSASASRPRESSGTERLERLRVGELQLKRLRVVELQHLLGQTNSKCPGCVEKDDYVRRCQQVWQELRRAPATVHVVSSEFDYLQEASEYEWISGPYDVTEPASDWVGTDSSLGLIRDWQRPRYERRRCQASQLARYGSCPALEYGTAQALAADDIVVQALLGGPSWTGWVVSRSRDAHHNPGLNTEEGGDAVWYHRAASDALLPQNISTPWERYDYVGHSEAQLLGRMMGSSVVGESASWARSKMVKIRTGDAGRVAWEKTQALLLTLTLHPTPTPTPTLTPTLTLTLTLNLTLTPPEDGTKAHRRARAYRPATCRVRRPVRRCAG